MSKQLHDALVLIESIDDIATSTLPVQGNEAKALALIHKLIFDFVVEQ